MLSHKNLETNFYESKHLAENRKGGSGAKCKAWVWFKNYPYIIKYIVVCYLLMKG